VHADSQKLSGVYAMSDEDTMDWDEEPIDWESLFAEVTETNEANSDSVATLELSEIAPDVFDAMHKAIIDQCDNDGYATTTRAARARLLIDRRLRILRPEAVLRSVVGE